VLLLCSALKYILGMSSKVKESIENPFKYETWLEGFHVGLRAKVLDTIATSAIYVLALSSDSGFPGFGYSGVVFLLTEFLLR
jgi:hypothetical protein